MKQNEAYTPQRVGYNSKTHPQVPSNIEAEREILAHCLLCDEIIPDLKAIGLTAEDFFLADHKLLFESILKMHGAGCPVSALTVLEEMNPSEAYRAFLLDLTSPSGYWMTNRKHTLYLAAIVQTKARLRRIMHLGEHAIKAAQVPGAKPDEIAATIASELTTILPLGAETR